MKNNGELLLDELLELIKIAGVYNVISISLAVLGILVAIFIYYKTSKKREPVYLIKNISLLDEHVNELRPIEVTYEKSKIKNLSVAHIAIWNAGKETVNKSDFAKSDPLRVVSSNNHKILDAMIVSQPEPTNAFKVSLLGKSLKKRVKIDFDYFDLNQGIVLKVYHTGNSKEDITVCGTVKKFGQIKSIDSAWSMSLLKVFEKYGFLNPVTYLPKKYKRALASIFLLVLPVVPLTEILFPEVYKSTTTKANIILSVLLIVIYWPLGYILLKRRVPKNFEEFDEI